jgi:hypothetical protein
VGLTPSSNAFLTSAAPHLPIPVPRVGRDVGGGDVERRLVEPQSARQRLVELRAVWPHRRVAVVAGHDGVDEITPALDRRLRHRRRRVQHCEQSHGSNQRATVHSQPSLLIGSRERPQPSSPGGTITPPADQPTSYHQKTTVPPVPTKKAALRAAFYPLCYPVLPARRQAGAGACACSAELAVTGPESFPFASVSRSTNSITATGAESP